MTQRAELEIGDSHNDTVQFIKSEVTGFVYISVNKGMQVRLEDPEKKQVLDFFSEEENDSGLFYVLRERRDNPLKIKVLFSNNSSSKFFTSRAQADLHQKRMTEQHGIKFKFSVVETV